MPRIIACWMILTTLSGFSPYGQAFQDSYKIGKLDVLKIEVPSDAEFTRESVTVSETGTISFPVLGELKVEGLTVSAVADMIRKALMDQKILIQPTVSVAIREYRSQPVTILGEVKTTGKYYLKGPERLLDKIAEAGGLQLNAGDIVISRTAAAGNQTITVKAADLLQDNTVIFPWDVIFIRAKEVSFVFVSGEVTSGKPITYTEGLTVSQAILMAGGINRFGSKSKVTIKRTVGGKEEMMRVNLSDIERGKAKDIPLAPNDTVLVGKRIF